MARERQQHRGRVRRPFVAERPHLAVRALAPGEIEFHDARHVGPEPDGVERLGRAHLVARPDVPLEPALARQREIPFRRKRKALEHLHREIAYDSPVLRRQPGRDAQLLHLRAPPGVHVPSGGLVAKVLPRALAKLNLDRPGLAGRHVEPDAHGALLRIPFERRAGKRGETVPLPQGVAVSAPFARRNRIPVGTARVEYLVDVGRAKQQVGLQPRP